MASRNYPESAEQKGIIDLVVMHSERYPVLTSIFHPANEGERTKQQHGRLIGEGLRAGVSDLVLPRARRGYLGLVMEMKAPGKIATTTPEQKSFLTQQQQEGWLACVCASAKDGWLLLRWYAEGGRHFGAPEELPIHDHRKLIFWGT